MCFATGSQPVRCRGPQRFQPKHVSDPDSVITTFCVSFCVSGTTTRIGDGASNGPIYIPIYSSLIGCQDDLSQVRTKITLTTTHTLNTNTYRERERHIHTHTAYACRAHFTMRDQNKTPHNNHTGGRCHATPPPPLRYNRCVPMVALWSHICVVLIAEPPTKGCHLHTTLCN